MGNRGLALWEEAPPAGQACGDDVEIYFGIMSRQVLREAIQALTAGYGPKTKPMTS